MNKKIMVVDDEPDQIFTVKQILEDMEEGYEVIGFESGIECLNFLKNNNIPDLILLDILMPDMNGWELLTKLRNNSKWKNIPVIFITAIDDKNNISISKHISEDFIEKPLDVSIFKNKIRRILKNTN